MKTIGIDQSLCTKSYFEHKFMNKIKNIYQHAGKCDDQKNLKDIIDAAMVSTPEWFTDNSPNVPMTSTLIKKKQVLGHHCVYSPTYWILNQKQQNVVLCLQNSNVKLWKFVVTCGPRKKTKRAFKNQWSDQT